MKKHIIILVTAFLLIFNLVIPTTVLSQEGRPKPKEWKGEGTKIEFPSIPTLTIKDFDRVYNKLLKDRNA